MGCLACPKARAAFLSASQEVGVPRVELNLWPVQHLKETNTTGELMVCNQIVLLLNRFVHGSEEVLVSREGHLSPSLNGIRTLCV